MAMDWDAYAATYPQLDSEDGVPPLLAGVLAAGTGRLLDMGCGEGRLLDAVRKAHPRWALLGFELSAARGRIARERGHDVVVGESGSGSLEPASFDVVVSTHVIEHVADDRAYARDLRRMVRAGGLVYLETPVRLRYGWYFRRNPVAGWVLDPTHVREYRREGALVRVLADAGLEVVAQQLTPVRFPLAAGLLLVRRVLGLAQRTEPRSGLGATLVPIPRYRQLAVLARRPAD